MPVDLTPLNQAISDLTAQLNVTVAGEDSAEVLIAGFAAAVTSAVAAALTADAAANATSIAPATAAIATVKQQFLDSSTKLAAAVAAQGTQPAPPAA